MAEKRSAGPLPQPSAKTVKLAEFCKASAYYGSRKGYVFKTGDKGLGYYLDNVAAAKQRVVQGHDGPGGERRGDFDEDPSQRRFLDARRGGSGASSTIPRARRPLRQ